AAGGDRSIDRLVLPAAHRVHRLAVEDARRVGTHHAHVGDLAAGADGELHQHLAGGAGAQGVGRVARSRHADRAQRTRRRGLLGGRRARLLLRGGLAGGGFALLGLAAGGGLALGGQARGFLLFGQPARRLGLGGLLLGDALALGDL